MLELLGVDDLVANESKGYEESEMSERYIDDVIDERNTAANLVRGVISRLDSSEFATEKSEHSEKEPTPEPPKVEEKKSTTSKRKRKRLTRKRMQEIPNFEIEDVLGEFELDLDGNQIIIKTKDGKLNDKYGRQVNRRGYLLDPAGNVVTRGGIFIFFKEEIDFDDEIPAPYCFQKVQSINYKVEAFSIHRKTRKRDKLAMQDAFIEREY